MAEHDHSQPSGRSIEALGLCVATEGCRAQGHTLARTNLPQSVGAPAAPAEICLSCTEVSGRLEGLRLWQSVCPCCFSSAFPQGLPTITSMHARTSPAPDGPASSS